MGLNKFTTFDIQVTIICTQMETALNISTYRYRWWSLSVLT
jgi:hypothetical protein